MKGCEGHKRLLLFLYLLICSCWGERNEWKKEGRGREKASPRMAAYFLSLLAKESHWCSHWETLSVFLFHPLTLSRSLFVFLLFLSQLDCSLNWNLLGKHAIHEVNNITYSHLSCDSQAAVVVHWMASPLGRSPLSCVGETTFKHLTLQLLSLCSPTGAGLSVSR